MKRMLVAIVCLCSLFAASRTAGEVVDVGAPNGAFWVANAIGWVGCGSPPPGYHEVAPNYRNTGDVGGRSHGVLWIRNLVEGDIVEVSLRAGCQRCMGGYPQGCGCLAASLHWIDSETDSTALLGPAVPNFPAAADGGECILGPVTVDVTGDHTGLMLVFTGSGASSIYNAYAAEFKDVIVDIPPHAAVIAANGVLHAPSSLSFTNATSDFPGLDDQGSGNSIAWIDFDNDGDLDLSSGAGANNINRLFLNRLTENGAVSFELSSDPLIANPNTTRGLAWGIFGGADQCLDLYQGLPFGDNVLLNNTCGAVADVTNSVTAGSSAQTNGVRVVDFDRDGRLDIHELRPDAPDRLLRNLGDWQFEEVQSPALNITDGSFDAAWGDVDNDGDQDAYVTREDPWPNVLLRNDGSGAFTDVTPAPLAITDRSQGATWGDYDNDGDLDLFVTNWQAPNHLFRNDGTLNFTDVTVAGMDVARRGQSAVWGDLNNDGWLDLYVANQGDANQLWLNVSDSLGGRTFEDVTYPAIADLGPSTGLGMADYDRDGDLDIYVGAHLGPNTLLRNELVPGSHWLEVDLVPSRSNDSAIGSRLTLSAGPMTMYREVGANNGMWSQEPTRQHFGLGTTNGPVHVAVAWASGAVTELDLASVDDVVAIAEPDVPPQALTFTDVFADSGFSNWTYVNQANVIDFNGDGWDDLFFARRDGMTPRLYINDCAGHFEEDNAALGALEGLMVEMVDFGDIDHDGDLDILARMADNTLRTFMLDGTAYTERTPASIQGAPFGDVGLLDSDNDGDLDIVGKSESSLSQGQLYLFVNEMMDFSPVVVASSITWIATADLDGDGLTDIVTTDGSSHRVFRNSGSNSFVELTNAGLAPNVHYEACMLDYDNDGDFDIYGGNPDWGGRHPRLSRNDGDMVFLDVTQESMSVGQHYYAAALAADPDRDGDLDYYNTMGAYTNGLFFENGDGAFVERSSHYGINVGGGITTKSGVWIDFDKDHDLDLLVVNTWNANDGWLFRNDVEAGNWLEVQPLAVQSNSSLRGVKVTAYWGEESQIQHYEFNPSYYPASRSRTKHFGLGVTSVVDSVVVRWPSGAVSVKRNIPANSTIQVQETARPHLTSIEDVPDDQGGFLSLTFSAVADGAPDGGGLFSQYDVQRWDNGGWVTAVTLPAQGVEPYDLIIETPDVLTVGAPPRFSKLRIAATTTGHTTMSISAVDSAYSIDNLPPPKPAAVLVDSPEDRYIVWTNADFQDFASACVFRGSEAGFTPGDPLTCPESGIFEESHLAWYFYRVQYSDIHGNLSEFSDELHGRWPTPVPNAVPTVLRLYPCQPNPFNPRTTIKYDLPEAGPVRLAVFDLAGRLVRTLVDESMPQGSHEAAWDGRDATGKEVGSGTYLARLEFGGKVEVVRMGLVR